MSASSGFETFGFNKITALRQTNITVVDDQDGLLGLLINDTVKKNDDELLVEVTNRVSADIEVTVSLDNDSDGTLSDLSGSSGNSITVPLDGATSDSTDSANVYINADVDNTMIPFTISATAVDSSFTFQASRETEAVSGNTSGGGVVITKINGFKADKNSDEWTVNKVNAESDEFELDRVEYEITDENGNVVSDQTENVSGFTYQGRDILITPYDGEEVTKGIEYTLTVRVYDIEDNFDIGTRTDTA